ncbi:phenylalanine--tRNA ligase subunit alpha [Candidatus Wolfebacteria bacterium]|nr:phenylalanine--tRNA ligase subunit alpha [Candidatus Wolfebacteria bacterium]
MSFEQIKKTVFFQIKEINNPNELENLRIKYLGRKGELTLILRGLKDLSIEKRRQEGPLAQRFKKELEEAINKKQKEISGFNSQKKNQLIDISRPGKRVLSGHLNPLTKIEKEIRQIFLAMNFSVVEGQEIEDDYHNFDALHIPKDHPARDAWDTFWLKPINDKQLKAGNKPLLRTHTSPMQIRYMEKYQPPFQIIVPGRVFRYEATDASHETTFKQVEGLMVGEDISLVNFKFIIEEFLKKLFGEKIDFEFRPSYYPFVEPGVDVYMKWKNKWLEVAGAGMVHPEVFRAVNYNPYKWQGFAFGFGLDRLAMIKYKIPDIRMFYGGDLRFVKQF